jgi:hypothetical protein
MESSSNTIWCEPHDHVVTQPTHKDTILGKPSKSSLIRVWHKDSLYLDTNTIRNGKTPPNKYWFANEKYKDDTMKSVVLR